MKECTPICSTVIIINFIVFLLYFTSIIKTIPCDNDMKSIFVSNFIHIDYKHLLANAFGIYALSRIEEKIGIYEFLKLLIFILVIFTILETLLHNIYKEINCSIGFSGIILGMITYEYIKNYGAIDYEILLSLIIYLIVPSYFSPNVSFSGHLLGVVAGIIASYII